MDKLNCSSYDYQPVGTFRIPKLRGSDQYLISWIVLEFPSGCIIRTR